MRGERLQAVEDAVRIFWQRHWTDANAGVQIEVAVITCGGTATVRQNFASIRNAEPPSLYPEGARAVGQAMHLALDEIETRRTRYRELRVDYEPPLIWLMACGAPEDADWREAATRATTADARGEVTVYPVGIGEDDSLTTLSEFASRLPLLGVEPSSFVRMFKWRSSAADLANPAAAAAGIGSEVKPSLPTGPLAPVEPRPGTGRAPIDWGRMDSDAEPFSIFLCYRKTDAEATVHRMHEFLTGSFGLDKVFMDSSIRPGMNWRKVLDDRIRKCGVLLVVVGPNWLSPVAPEGISRLHDKNDYVRLEIEIALSRRVPILPVYLDSTPPLQIGQLPETIAEFADLQGLKLDQGQYFKPFMEYLIEELRKLESVSY